MLLVNTDAARSTQMIAWTKKTDDIILQDQATCQKAKQENIQEMEKNSHIHWKTTCSTPFRMLECITALAAMIFHVTKELL